MFLELNPMLPQEFFELHLPSKQTFFHSAQFMLWLWTNKTRATMFSMLKAEENIALNFDIQTSVQHHVWGGTKSQGD